MSLPNAFVTVLTTPSYLPGALVVLNSILELHPEPRQFKTVCLVTPETVDARTIGEVRKAGFDLVIGVEPIGSGVQGAEGLKLMGRPDLNLALTKLHLFRLHTLFSTIIYLDADVLPLRPLSHLFTTTAPHILSAAPDTGWPDCFNSGVMVIRPREKDWDGLRKLLKNGEGEEGIYLEGSEVPREEQSLYGNGSFDGADQGLLNEYFSEDGEGGGWNRLSFLYNVTPSAAYQYEPAYRRYGHKVNAVHFIGPNKPWSSLSSRPAGMSLPKGKEAKFDYPSLIDRWYEVYDRNVRPAAAHHPDLAQRFKVPEHVAVWNSQRPQDRQLGDRLDLDQLKAAVGVGMTAMKPGQYTSLPLDGRVDLIMPKPQPVVRDPSPPKSPALTADSPPHHIHAPPPQTMQQQMTRPAIWDAQRYSPPAGGRPEMSTPMTTVYNAAWDDSPAQQVSTYSNPSPHKPEPQYPTIPDNVKRDTWYSNFTGSSPDRSSIKPVFPWEQANHQNRAPDRVFPRGTSPPPSFRPSENKSTESQPSSISNAATTRSPPPETASSPSSPSSRPSRSMAEAMASYTNAWDNMPSIQRYVDRVSGRPGRSALGELPKGFDMSTLKSVPPTPTAESISLHHRQRSADGRSEASGDGDDEDDGASQDSDRNDSPAVGSTNTGRMTDRVPFPYPGNTRYRDRHAQTDRKVLSDAKVQVVPGGGPSPALKTVQLPIDHNGPSSRVSHSNGNGHRGGHSSSSDTTARAPSLLTPTGSDQSHRLPLPGHPSGTVRRLSDNGNTPKSSPGNSRRTSGDVVVKPITDSGIPPPDQRPSRKFDPSTDPDMRKKDTQQVLNRFMQEGVLP